MSSVGPLTELLPAPGVGRAFSLPARAGVCDCAPDGRVRLDALARWTQDLAFADNADAGISGGARWILRRSRMRVERFPRFDEPVELLTFNSGVGRMWGERRSSVLDGNGDSLLESGSLWIYMDPVSGRPAPLGEIFTATYGEAIRGRRVKAHLRHPPPTAGATKILDWQFRSTDVDVARHVNNTAYWGLLDAGLLDAGAPERIDAEIEFRRPAQPGPVKLLADGGMRWIVNETDLAESYASILLSC